jgi:hypothetical protein
VTGLERLRSLDPPAKIFVAATGAGAGVQRALWSVPGASAFFVGAAFPYAAAETARLLGFEPARYCDPAAALELAMAAYLRAREAEAAQAEWGAAAPPAIGLGLTASVATLEPHRGDHRVFVATFGPRAAALWSARLTKGVGGAARARDGEAADALALHALLEAAGLPSEPPVAPGLELERRDVAERELRVLLFERPLFGAGGERLAVDAAAVRAAILFPGSFAPFHAGHRAVADAVEATAGRPSIYAVTADPVHKPALGAADLLDRVASVRRGRAGRPVLLTRGDPLFIHKARQFPGAGLALGVDAVIRMLDPAWGPDVDEMLEELAALGTRFFVMGRAIGGRWTTLDDVAIPARFRGLFTEVEGRLDVSSTEVRRGLDPGLAE